VDNNSFLSVGGVLFDRSQTTLIQFPVGSGATSYSIPNGVTNIGNSAFYDCPSLSSVTIPSSVINIGDSAFSACFSLTSVYFQGNAPSVGSDVFSYSSYWYPRPVFDPATAYYLPGTTGWDAFATNAEIQTALWLPQIQTSNGSFGVNSNQFGFNINWASGMTVVVEASTSLSGGAWTPLQTNTLTSGSFYFSDPEWTKYPSRFYRLRSP
jgi:hypothetical protein